MGDIHFHGYQPDKAGATVLSTVMNNVFYSSGEQNNYFNLNSYKDSGAKSLNDVYFDASRVVPTASDNHPYSIYMVPLISY